MSNVRLLICKKGQSCWLPCAGRWHSGSHKPLDGTFSPLTGRCVSAARLYRNNAQLISGHSNVRDVFQKEWVLAIATCTLEYTYFAQLTNPLSTLPFPVTDLFSSVVLDSPNYHAPELFLLIYSEIRFKTSCVQLNFLKMEFLLPRFPTTIEIVTVQRYRADALKIKMAVHQGEIP